MEQNINVLISFYKKFTKNNVNDSDGELSEQGEAAAAPASGGGQVLVQDQACQVLAKWKVLTHLLKAGLENQVAAKAILENQVAAKAGPEKADLAKQ